MNENNEIKLGDKDDWKPEVEGMDRQPTGDAGESVETVACGMMGVSTGEGGSFGLGGLSSLWTTI